MIGKGAHGTVYLGHWRGLDVAVKRITVPSVEGPAGEASRQGALKEASIHASLTHANVVATYSYSLRQLVVEGGGGVGEQVGVPVFMWDVCMYGVWLRLCYRDVWCVLCEAHKPDIRNWLRGVDRAE